MQEALRGDGKEQAGVGGVSRPAGWIGDETGLPLQVFEESGESMVKPCAEVLMTQRAAETISSRGIMPLASMKGEDRVRLLGVHSVARPETSLVGRWRRSQ